MVSEHLWWSAIIWREREREDEKKKVFTEMIVSEC